MRAEKLGFKQDKSPPFKTNGKLAFKKGERWISGDRDCHNGGRWKMYNNRGQRIGAFDINLNLIRQ